MKTPNIFNKTIDLFKNIYYYIILKLVTSYLIRSITLITLNILIYSLARYFYILSTPDISDVKLEGESDILEMPAWWLPIEVHPLILRDLKLDTYLELYYMHYMSYKFCEIQHQRSTVMAILLLVIVTNNTYILLATQSYMQSFLFMATFIPIIIGSNELFVYLTTKGDPEMLYFIKNYCVGIDNYLPRDFYTKPLNPKRLEYAVVEAFWERKYGNFWFRTSDDDEVYVSLSDFLKDFDISKTTYAKGYSDL